MSIEVRETRDQHGLECDWGVFKWPRPHPARDEVGALMLAVRTDAERLLEQGPTRGEDGAMHSVTVDSERHRRYYHVDYGAQHWTWELFDAHWGYGENLPPLLVGRWP